jgi:glycerol uptake facilitator-like aquaporin
LTGALVLINLSYPIFKKKIKTTDYNFSDVVRNMELEIICGFSLFYILMVVIDGYDIYSITDQLFTIVDSSIQHYMLALIVFIVSLLLLYIKK